MNPPEEEMVPIYKVTIEMKQRLVTLTPREWTRVNTLNDEEKRMSHIEKQEKEISEYGYTPQVKQVEVVKRKIFEQEIPGMDVRAVICAINGIVLDEALSREEPYAT